MRAKLSIANKVHKCCIQRHQKERARLKETGSNDTKWSQRRGSCPHGRPRAARGSPPAPSWGHGSAGCGVDTAGGARGAHTMPLSFVFNTECSAMFRVGCRAEAAVVAWSRDNHPSLACWPQNVQPRTDYRANGPICPVTTECLCADRPSFHRRPRNVCRAANPSRQPLVVARLSRGRVVARSARQPPLRGEVVARSTKERGCRAVPRDNLAS